MPRARRSPVTNATVTSTGATSDANGTTGYGTNTDAGNTYNILAGASVTGTLLSLVFSTASVNNAGTILARRFFDVFGNNGVVVNNSGTISANGANANAIGTFSRGSLHPPRKKHSPQTAG